ncbi:hypothetical protein D3C84_1212990 [compost metagenome]
MLGFFHSLRNHLDLQAMGQCDDGLCNDRIAGIVVAIENEGLINLEAIDREALQIGQAGKSCTEIVQR